MDHFASLSLSLTADQQIRLSEADSAELNFPKQTKQQDKRHQLEFWQGDSTLGGGCSGILSQGSCCRSSMSFGLPLARRSHRQFRSSAQCGLEGDPFARFVAAAETDLRSDSECQPQTLESQRRRVPRFPGTGPRLPSKDFPKICVRFSISLNQPNSESRLTSTIT
jgi:hypothetical protein